jgi:putative zinc finger protein
MDRTKEPQHEPGLLGAYVLDVLDPEERRQIEEHLAGCAECRAELAELEAVKNVLDELPPEALLHGPPDADLVLQRTLRQMRSESSTQNRRGWSMAVAAAAIVLAVALGAGVAIGRGTKSSVQGGGVNPTPSVITVTPPASPLPSGTRSGRATDPTTGATIEATVVPAAGWVRVNAQVGGIPAGENCRLVVVGRNDPNGEVAGGWVVSPKGAQSGTPLNGSAAVPPGEVTAIKVVDAAGKTYVTLKL